MEELYYTLWLILWIPLSLLVVSSFIFSLGKDIHKKYYGDLWMIIPLIIVILISVVGTLDPLSLPKFVLSLLGWVLTSILVIALFVVVFITVKKMVMIIAKSIIKEVSKMTEEAKEEIKESKEKKGE